MKLPIVKQSESQKCPRSEPEQFTFDNFQSNHPVVFWDKILNHNYDMQKILYLLMTTPLIIGEAK